MLSISDISVRIAGRLLIDNSSAQIVPGARVGFVGRNGVGKSTLFSAIRGELPIESGTIAIPPRWRIGSLAQEAPDGPESLIEVVLKADLERDALLPRLDAFAPQLLFVSAGFDAHRDDPLAQGLLDAGDFAWITRELVEIANRHARGRIVSSLEGGYDLDALASSAVAHVDALRG